MPSHIAHTLFGKETARFANFSIVHPKWFTLGCQGPDIFLHNQRTMPSSLFWGKSLHRKNYGLFCSSLISAMKAAGANWSSPIGSYIFGFMTHAILDRESHPFITYFSGWGKENRMLHPFFERLIDIEISRSLSAQIPGEFSFFNSINLGPVPPEIFTHVLSSALQFHFNNPYSQKDMAIRITNAYDDTMHFLEKTDFWSIDLIERIKIIENNSANTRLLALFHPPYIPYYLDVLNINHSEWKHPWIPEISSNKSFLDIFTNSIQIAVKKISPIFIENSDNIEFLIGNNSLNTGLPYSSGVLPKVSSPIPLGKFLQELYK
jgi:hypothetical protein